ncbi:MAG: Fe-S-cluster containining protein [Desulforhopalus sp.]|jgi:Fe-S-cluster containining protein
MKELTLCPEDKKELEDIYAQLQQEYERVAAELQFSCTGCPDNCCDSYFLHHTYAEWAYLWEGVRGLDKNEQDALIERATLYLTACEQAEQQGERPQVMCPVNNEGRCQLYKHRLLVCRTHGVPAKMTRPDGQSMQFPGCFRCQEIVEEKGAESVLTPVERTPFLRRLAILENQLLHMKRHLHPKARLTIAEMLVKGPPEVSFGCGEE